MTLAKLSRFLQSFILNILYRCTVYDTAVSVGFELIGVSLKWNYKIVLYDGIRTCL